VSRPSGVILPSISTSADPESSVTCSSQLCETGDEPPFPDVHGFKKV